MILTDTGTPGSCAEAARGAAQKHPQLPTVGSWRRTRARGRQRSGVRCVGCNLHRECQAAISAGITAEGKLVMTLQLLIVEVKDGQLGV